MNIEHRMQKMPKNIFLNKNIKELDTSQAIAYLKGGLRGLGGF